MGVGIDLHEYSVEEAKRWAKKKNLEPGLVKNTKDSIRFVTKGGTDRIDVIDWVTFLEILKRKNLAIFGTNEGWMKIMRKK